MYLSGTKCAALALSCVLSLSSMAKNAVPAVGQGVQKPFSFVENKGQLLGADGKQLTGIQFMMSTAGMNLYLGNGQLHYQFRKQESADAASFSMKTYRMDVTLLGANPNANVEAAEMQPYYENYFTSASNAEGVVAHTYNRVTYKNVYPGIDWVLYIKGDKVEYDFVVQPGADASLIKLQYGGATALRISKDGGISAETPMGSVGEKKPYAYERATGRQVAAEFQLDKNVVSFATGKSSGTLVIDPYILWSTYFGGANEDVATCVKISGGGNTYIGGYTTSTTVSLGTPPTVYDNTFNGGYDAFITKYNATGVRQFTTYFGGAGNDRGTCIAIDAAGSGIFLGGYTAGSTGLGAGALYHTANNGLNDGFIFKINNNGTRQWSTYYGGAGNDYIYGITCDASSNVYVTGRTESAATIASAGAFQTVLGGSADAFVAKFINGTGANSYSTYYGGTGVDEGVGITTDASNNAFITGQTNSIINIATPGAHQTTLSGATDAFVGMLNTTGSARVWGTYFGRTGSEQGKDIICNTTTGDVALIGYTTSTSGMATPNAHQTAYGGGVQDAFVAYLSNAGALAWSTYYGGPALDYGESITLDPQRNVIIAGGTFSTTGISTPISLQPAIGGNYDAFVAKFTVLGQRIWGSYFGDALYDYAFGVTCDNTGQIIMAGHTSSNVGIASAGSEQTVYGGGIYDGFVTKFRPDTVALITQPYTDTLVCAGGQLRLVYSVNIPFQPGNTFTAQLSNASGSFASPVNIGTSATNLSGNIICTIPAGTPIGTGYRIRITGSNPVYVSPDQFVNITVVPALPLVTLTGNTPVCVGYTLSLTSTATWSISGYSWTGPGPFASAAANPTIPSVGMANSGTYTLVTTHNGCPANTSTINITVNNVIPPAPVASSSTLNCNLGSLYLYADIGSTGNYYWTGPAGFTSTMQNPVITPTSMANDGDYYVVDTVAGCASVPAMVSVAITPNTPVSVNITVSPNDTVCGGTNVSFTSSIVNGGISPAFQWMNGVVPVVGAMSPTWSSSTLTDGAMISCVLTSNAVCPFPANATSNVIKMNIINNEPLVYINANPGVSVNPGDSITFNSVVYNVGVGPTYQWQLNGIDIWAATNSTYTKRNITQYDTISLVVTSTMDCATNNFGISNKLVIHPNTAVADVSALFADISLFPNPNAGTFTIRGAVNGANTGSVNVAVLNPLGQVVFENVIEVQNGKINRTLNIDQLPSGVYLLQLSADGRSKAVRFSVQH